MKRIYFNFLIAVNGSLLLLISFVGGNIFADEKRLIFFALAVCGSIYCLANKPRNLFLQKEKSPKYDKCELLVLRATFILAVIPFLIIFTKSIIQFSDNSN